MDLQKEVDSYLLYCEKQKKLSHYTIKAYKIDLYQFLSEQNDITRNCITDYVSSLHDKFKPKTAKRKIASLKAFMRYLYCTDIIPLNPFDKIDTSFKEPQMLPRTIPSSILKNILVASYSNIGNAKSDYAKMASIRDTAVIELLFATGARISEICSLKVESVNLSEHTVLIFGKGSKERIINIENYDVLKILERYKDTYLSYLQPGGFFFLNNRRNRLSEQSVRFMIKRLEKQVDSKIHITPHMFRHSVATMLLEEDVDIRYIQKILGHSSITTTQIYTHVTSTKQKEIIRTKHPRNKLLAE